jgi:hypothetical protein
VHNNVENTDYYKTLNKYQKDFLILTTTVKESYPNCRELIDDTLWQKTVNSGIKRLQQGNDTTASLEYQKFLAMLKDNHSYIVYPSVFELGKKIFMVCIYRIDEKWMIPVVHKSYPAELIKTQVISINDIPVDTFYKTIKPYIGQQSEEMLYHAAGSQVIFGRKAFIEALGLGYKPNKDSMKLIVRDSANIERTYFIAPVNLKDAMQIHEKSLRSNPYNATDSGYVYRFYPEYKMAYIQMNGFMDKKSWKRGIKEEVPFIFRPFAYLMLKNAYKGKIGGRLSGVRPGTENITKFYEDFFTKFQKTGYKNLVIDVRNNNGGNMFYTYQLLSFLTDKQNIKTGNRYIKYTEFYKNMGDDKQIQKDINHLTKVKINYDTLVDVSALDEGYNALKKINNPDYEYYVNSKDKKFTGNVYVMTSPNSVSAATLFPTLVQDNKIGVIIGRSPANRVSKQTSSVLFKLPNTSIAIALSMLYTLRPDITNTNEILVPDYIVPYELSKEDYTLKYTLKLIENKNKTVISNN